MSRKKPDDVKKVSTMKASPTRKIIHVDMDAFFAAVEQRDHPEYRGKPIIVGGSPDARGVVSTCSYEARTFGIHSAMPARVAKRLCPQAIFVRPRMERYRQVSQQIFQIYKRFTDLIEPLALDEAFLDVTQDKLGIGSATLIARKIKESIYAETGLTASAGVSYNKFLAKIASDYQKPDGLTVVTPEQAEQFIDRIPIGDFFGVGKVTEEKFLARGVRTGADLRKLSEAELIQICQKRGKLLYQHVRGIDERPVVVNRQRKSLGKETTLPKNVYRLEDMLPILETCAEKVSQQLKQKGLLARTVVLKVRFHDFQMITRRKTLEIPTADLVTIMEHIETLLKRIDFTDRSVRLLGVTATELIDVDKRDGEKSNPLERYVQLELFPN